MGASFWGRCSFDLKLLRGAGQNRHIPNSDRNHPLDWWTLLAEASALGNRNADAAPGNGNPSRMTGGDHFVFPYQESGCVRMDVA